MKSTIWVGLLLLLTCTYTQLPIAEANIVTDEGTVASYAPYITYPSNTSYPTTVSLLNVSFRAEVWGNVKYSMVFSLDGKENESLPLVDHYFSWVQGQHDKSYVDGSVVLPELANGSHSIKVFVECNWQIGYSTGWKDNYYYDSEEVHFTVANSISTSYNPSLTTETPTTLPFTLLKPSFSPSVNQTETITSYPTSFPSFTNSPTQQPILEPSITDSPTPFKETGNPNLALEITVAVVLVAIAVVSLIFLLQKNKETEKG